MSFSPETRADLGRFWTTIERSAEIGVGRPGGLADDGRLVSIASTASCATSSSPGAKTRA